MIKCHRSTFSRKLHYKEHDKSLDTMGKRTIHCAKENKSRLWSNLSSNAEMILLSMTMPYCFSIFLFGSKRIEYRKQHMRVVSNVRQWKDLPPLCRISDTINLKSFNSSYIIIPAMNTYIYHLCFPRFCEIVG